MKSEKDVPHNFHWKTKKLNILYCWWLLLDITSYNTSMIKFRRRIIICLIIAIKLIIQTFKINNMKMSNIHKFKYSTKHKSIWNFNKLLIKWINNFRISIDLWNKIISVGLKVKKRGTNCRKKSSNYRRNINKKLMRLWTNLSSLKYHLCRK